MLTKTKKKLKTVRRYVVSGSGPSRDQDAIPYCMCVCVDKRGKNVFLLAVNHVMFSSPFYHRRYENY